MGHAVHNMNKPKEEEGPHPQLKMHLFHCKVGPSGWRYSTGEEIKNMTAVRKRVGRKVGEHWQLAVHGRDGTIIIH